MKTDADPSSPFCEAPPAKRIEEEIILGIAGAFLATFVGQAIGHYSADQGAGFITATIGAVVVLFIWHRLVASGVIKG